MSCYTTLAHSPTVSFKHFLMLLFLAAPASLRSAAAASHFSVASRSHFFKNDVLAAPASFFSCAAALQVGAGVCAKDEAVKPKLVSSTKMVAAVNFIVSVFFADFDDCGALLCWVAIDARFGCIWCRSSQIGKIHRKNFSAYVFAYQGH